MTSKGTCIPNQQDSELAAYDLNLGLKPYLKPNRVIRTDLSPVFNCHGMTFASRRTRILFGIDVWQIIRDDQYLEVQPQNIIEGDIILYIHDDGDVDHSGVVVGVTRPPEIFNPLICSKWGGGPEILHRYGDVHASYGAIRKFYRCSL